MIVARVRFAAQERNCHEWMSESNNRDIILPDDGIYLWQLDFSFLAHVALILEST